MRLKAILTLKCPRCLRGNVYRSFFKMNKSCPHCGVVYEREQGYFMTAVFVGYVMGFVIAVLAGLGLYLTVKPDAIGYLLGASGVVFLSIPLVFHYARVVWMHIDELLDPRKPEELEAARRNREET
ncbi:MAG TPA: DUF983 domain-containing protein [Chromatiaceae bacterium]|nr:DUF983 domain-containing protein [Chromatiaceae bacterium]